MLLFSLTYFCKQKQCDNATITVGKVALLQLNFCDKKSFKLKNVFNIVCYNNCKKFFLQGTALATGTVEVEMNVLITVWNGRVSPVFDVAGEALIIEVKNSEVISRKAVPFPTDTFFNRVEFMLSEKISLLICGAISRQAEMTIINKGITVHPFLSGDIEEIIEAVSLNKLFEMNFSMPGCVRSCLLYTSPSPRDRTRSRMPSSA